MIIIPEYELSVDEGFLVPLKREEIVTYAH
jgi:hypothetical protein